MGVHCGEIPRNCSREHACGHCCFGCPSGDKQDATGTYLSDAAKSGAKIFTGVQSNPLFCSCRFFAVVAQMNPPEDGRENNWWLLVTVLLEKRFREGNTCKG